MRGNVDELLPGRVRGSGLPPYRPPQAGAGDAWATPASPYARQLHFGGSSAAAAGRGGGNGGVFPDGSSSGAGGVRQRVKSSGAVPGRQRTNTALHGDGSQRINTAIHGGSGQRVLRPRAPRAPRSAVRGQASGSGAPFDIDEELEDDVEELASSGGPLKKQYLKSLQWGPLGNEELLDELFRGLAIDGSTAFVPGDDYVKKSKSPMVKIVKDIANTFKDSVKVNTTQIQKCASDKAACSVERCQELAFECGVEETVDSVYAMSKMFEKEYQRQFFCGKLTPQLRLGYFKKWCRDNNLSLGGVE
ncbi:unnamed protein product [Miscanthus lutarioriparius]|uniref:Uncharacterized protein n=1 Tax=Miscanthus lutarioriparius TaxID=422564 RepID=A0A811QWN3_9POAL|nr:unnamed protein product [Miscanthus lutarioriparius]